MVDKCWQLLEQRGVHYDDIVQLVLAIQQPFTPSLTYEYASKAVDKVMSKREVQYAIITGINIDMLVEKGQFDDDLNQLLMSDNNLYGIDEVLAYSICNLHGSMALTNFGYVDCSKKGILDQINHPADGVCNTFLDDLVGAIAASAASLIAYANQK